MLISWKKMDKNQQANKIERTLVRHQGEREYPSVYGGSAKYGGSNNTIYFFIVLVCELNPLISDQIPALCYSTGYW